MNANDIKVVVTSCVIRNPVLYSVSYDVAFLFTVLAAHVGFAEIVVSVASDSGGFESVQFFSVLVDFTLASRGSAVGVYSVWYPIDVGLSTFMAVLSASIF